MNKLRVLLYPQYSAHAHGGPSTVAYHLSTELKKYVDLSYYPSFQTSIQQISFKDYTAQLFGVCEKACKRNFDIQHFIMLPTLLNGSYPFAWLSKEGGLPLIINIHGILHLEHTFWEKNYFDKAKILSMKSSTLFLCKKASRLVVNSEFSYKNLIDWYGVEPEKVVIIPNGINLTMFQSIPNSSNNLVLEGDPTILFVGSHFSYSKGVDTLIKAIAIAKQDFPNIQLHVVGSSGNVLPELRSLILKEGVENNIHFHGWIGQEELYQYYNAADFCIFSSILETFGIVLIEAMASGTPIIASDIDAYQEILTDKKTALLFKRGDPNALAQKISIFASNFNLRKQLSRNALEAVKIYDWDNVVLKYVNLYKNLG